MGDCSLPQIHSQQVFRSAFAHWKKRWGSFDQAKAKHGWLDRSESFAQSGL